MRILALSFSILFSICSTAQLVVDNDLTPIEYVQQVLLGEGVTISNVTFNGTLGTTINNQCGGFDGLDSNVGMEAGVILATCGVDFAEGPNENGIASPPDDSQSGDPDLEEISDENINDQAILEFDFVPQGDTLRFNYVFASDEYPEYVNQFNDAFGFFLSGPGITGSYSSPPGFPDGSVNIAIVPGVDIPVTINNVNNGDQDCFGGGPNGPCVNCEFYVDNCGGETVEFDGFTTVLEAFALVECGETYHIKLAIGDAIDGALDSGVFLEAGSFSAEPAGLTLTSLFPLGLVEISDNCDTAIAVIRRQCAVDSSFYNLNYLINDSTATYGEDYEDLPTELVMIPGQSEAAFGITTITDDITEGFEYICIEVSESDSLMGTYTVIDTACVAIVDSYTFPATANEILVYCPDDSVNLSAFPDFPGVAPYDISWFLDGEEVFNGNPYTAPVPLSVFDTTFYDVVIEDFCGAFNDPTLAYVGNLIAADPTLDIQQGTQYCPGLGHELSGGRQGGTFPFSYDWTDEYGVAYNDSSTIIVDPAQDYPFDSDSSVTYFLTLSDICNPTRVAFDTVEVVFPEALALQTGMNEFICTDQELQISSTASGGYPPYNYTWNIENIDGVSLPLTIEPFPFPGQGSAMDFVEDEMAVPDALYLLDLQLDDWCSSNPLSLVSSDFTIDTVEARDCFVPNVVTANGDGSNDSFIVYRLINTEGVMTIYNRWGNIINETSLHVWTPEDQPEGTYFYTVQYQGRGAERGSFTILR